jgi:hypothetical protein
VVDMLLDSGAKYENEGANRVGETPLAKKDKVCLDIILYWHTLTLEKKRAALAELLVQPTLQNLQDRFTLIGRSLLK